MTARRLAMALPATLLLLVTAWSAVAQSPDDKAAMEAMTKAATPGPLHAFWARSTGTWKVHTRMWIQPGTAPLESEATAEVSMILGGRYLKEDFHGRTTMGPFQGMSLSGCDVITGKVTAIWIDDMSTAVSVLTGQAPKPGQPLELTGTYDDPVSGQTLKIRTVTTYQDDDHSRFEYFMQPPGQEEFRSMVMEYERVAE